MHALALLYQLAWQVDGDPYVLMLLRGRTREALLAEVARPRERDADARCRGAGGGRVRAAQILALAEDAPSGHGLADAAVAAYDEAVSRLLWTGSQPSAFCAIEESNARISSAGRKALCGVELSSPKAACTPARACFGPRSGRIARSWRTHTST